MCIENEEVVCKLNSKSHVSYKMGHGSSSLELEENEDGATVAANREVEKVKQSVKKKGQVSS